MFRPKIWNYCFGKNVGNFKTNSTSSQIYVYGALFSSTGKIIEPTLEQVFGFFPNLGKGRDISSYYVKVEEKSGTYLGEDNND